MNEVVELLARRLVDDPSAVAVEEVDDEEGGRVLLLHVAPDDRGKVIGRGGRTVRALRTLVRAAYGASSRRVRLEIAE